MATQAALKVCAALRSDEYRQGRNRLRSEDDEFCCLGVACDVFHKETGRGEWQLSEQSGGYDFILDGIGEPALLLAAVQEWIGFDTPGGAYNDDPCAFDGQGHTLFEDNDDLGYDFERIADVIEHNDTLYAYDAEHVRS